MSPIETSINRELDLTVHTVSGNVTPQEYFNKIETYYQGKPTTLVLWDCTTATGEKFTADELRDFLRIIKKYSRKGGKTALVFSMDVDFGIGRMLGSLAQIESYDFEVEAFRRIEDAKKWLGLLNE